MLLSKFTLFKWAALALIGCSMSGSQLVTRGLLFIRYMAFFFYELGIITPLFPISAWSLSEQQRNYERLLQLVMHKGSFGGQP